MSYFQDNMMRALEQIQNARPGHSLGAVTIPRRAILLGAGLVRYRPGYENPREIEITPRGVEELAAWWRARSQRYAESVPIAPALPRRPVAPGPRIQPIIMPAPRLRFAI